jgi:glycosyltransferase involved in cell wall biosynthesis
LKLQNKTILLISPQAWGNMYLSKHHYAIALAKLGNEVYFLNPPNVKHVKNEVEIVESKIHPSLFIINHSLFFSKKLKFKFIWLFHLLMKFHIKKIKKNISKEIDIVWSFDLGNYYPLKCFGSAYKIFSPFDKPQNNRSINSAKNSDIIISVAPEIIEHYSHFNVPKHFIHHGLADEFFNQNFTNQNANDNIRIGLSGNWLRKDIDTDCLLKIIRDNSNIIFEIWGSYKISHSNIGGARFNEMDEFIKQLIAEKNVMMHGVVHPRELAIQFQRMNGFLICYNILKDHSKGTNYHKIMEYLSTGKVVISNNISNYNNIPGLLEMTESRENNDELPSLFKQVLENLAYYNSSEKMKSRIFFAQSNSYSKRIEQIEGILAEF